MAIKFWGDSLNVNSQGRLVWFAQSLIPVFDESHIPEQFKAHFLGFETGERTVEKKPVYDREDPDVFYWDNQPPWTATTITLNDFQFDLLWALNAGWPIPEELPPYLDAYDNREYQSGEFFNFNLTTGTREIVEMAGISTDMNIPDDLKDVRIFKVQKIFIGDSEEASKYRRERGSLDEPYDVHYVVGSLVPPEIVTVEAQQATIQTVIPPPKKPKLVNIIRNTDNFSEAILQTIDAQKTEGNFPAQVKVKFIFDNGIEKYADIISIEEE